MINMKSVNKKCNHLILLLYRCARLSLTVYGTRAVNAATVSVAITANTARGYGGDHPRITIVHSSTTTKTKSHVIAVQDGGHVIAAHGEGRVIAVQDEDHVNGVQEENHRIVALVGNHVIARQAGSREMSAQIINRVIAAQARDHVVIAVQVGNQNT